METAFEAANPDVDVVVTEIGASDYYNKIVEWQAAGTLPDVLMQNNLALDSLIDMGVFADITTYWENYTLKDLYYPEAVNLLKGKDGKQYGVPQNLGGIGLLVRKDLMVAKGINPKQLTSWNDWLDAMEATQADTNGDNIIDLWGTVWPFGDQFMTGALFAQLMICNGIPLLDLKTELVQYQQNWIEGFQFIKDLRTRNLVSPDSFSMTFPDTGTAWGVGTAATVQIGPFVVGMLANSTQFINQNQAYGLTAPAGPHGEPMWQPIVTGYEITNTSKVKDTAWKFITFANSKYYLGKFLASPGGHDGVRYDITPEYMASEFGKEIWWVEMWTDAEVGKLYDKKLDPQLEPNYSIWHDYITKVALGDLEPAAAFQQFKADLLQAIG